MPERSSKPPSTSSSRIVLERPKPPAAPGGPFRPARSPFLLFGLAVVLPTLVALLLAPGVAGVFFSGGDFMPHAHCYLENPLMIALHGVSDFLIGVAYMAISVALVYLVYKARNDVPFEWMFLAFGAFIFTCGGTHLLELWTLWHPIYWVSGTVKAITAVASVATAIGIFPLLPRIFRLIETAKASEKRRCQLEVANRELDAFSHSVSHDLRAPLRAIGGFSSLLQSQYSPQLDPQANDYLLRISRATRQMEQLVASLLDLARVSRVELRREPVDLAGIAKAVIEQLRQGEPQRQVEIGLESAPAEADPALMRIALENLLNNAWKFTRQQPVTKIGFGVRSGTGEIFFVRDNGAGLDLGRAANLFEPFQRFHSASEFPGTGVGLATVRRIIERHGGRIWVESAPGQGATFFFTLRQG